MQAMEADTGASPALIRADGGLVANKFVCQFIADMTGIPLELPNVIETTAWGAACAAALHAGVFSGLPDIARNWKRARRYDPQMNPADAAKLYEGWRDGIRRIM
jgi:glycerol kinase